MSLYLYQIILINVFRRLSCQLVDCFRCPISVIDIVSPTFYDNILVPANQFRTNDLHFSELEIRPVS